MWRSKRRSPKRSVSAASPSPSPSAPSVKVKVVVQPKPARSLPAPESAPPPEANAPPRHRVNVWVSSQKPPVPPADTNPGTAAEPAVPPRHRVNVWVSSQQRQGPSPEDLWDEDLWEEEPAALAAPSSNGVRLMVSPELVPPRNGWWQALLLLGLWAGIGVGMAAGTWTALQLVINPGSVTWLSWLFPEWSREAERYAQDAPKPLHEWRAIARDNGLRLGDPIALAQAGTPPEQTDLLVPVFDGEELLELRLYFPEAGAWDVHYRLGGRLLTPGPDEFFVTAPLVRVTARGPGSSRLLPLDRVEALDPQPPGRGLWLCLSGTYAAGRDRLRFGYIAHYDPRRQQVRLVMPWTSPVGGMPTWQALTASPTPELVIDQTVGLEPSFLVYQLQHPDSPTELAQLVPISLQQNHLDNGSYDSALLLARQGLWSPALEILESVRERVGDRWSANAQAQLDVIAMHAAVTRQQAEQDWGTPGQQVIALAIDGRWERAWDALMQALERDRNSLQLLRGDDNRLWRRVEAAARVSPRREAVQTWAVLRQYVRQGRPAAVAWLASHTNAPNGNLDARSRRILQTVDAIALTQEDGAPTTPGWLYGLATPLPTVDANAWQQPDGSPPTLPPNQQWYRVRVEQAHDGTAWQSAPFAGLLNSTTTPRYLWSQLGLGRNASLSLTAWDGARQPQTIEAIAHALRWDNGTLEVLVATPNASGSAGMWVAQTASTLTWHAPHGTTNLDTLAAQNPQWATRFAPILSAELQRAGRLPADWRETGQAPFYDLGRLTLQTLDVTGNDQPDFILEIVSAETTLDVVNEGDRPTTAAAPQTAIFSDQGTVLYSDFGQGAGGQVMAIASPQGDAAPVLILRNGSQYQFRRWSP